MVLVFFSVRGEGKCEINYQKKIIFFPLGAFSPFLFVSLPEKMIRKCFGGRRRGREQKKVI